MEINYIIYPIVILAAFLFSQGGNTVKDRKRYIIFVLFVLLLEVVLRSLSVGSDTHKYYELFYTYSSMSWDEIWTQFVTRYTVGGTEDIGYISLVKAIGGLTHSWFVYTTLTTLMFFIPFGIFLLRYTKNFQQITLAFLIYITLFHVMALSGGRQLWAMGLGVLSFISIDQNRYLRAVVLILVGSLIHQSLLLCLLPILMSRLNPTALKWMHIAAFLLIPIVMLNVNSLLVFMGEVAQNEKYMRYGQGEVVGGGFTFIALLEACSLLCFIAFNKQSLKEDRTLKLLYAMVPLFTLFGPTIYSNGSMIRISMYFHLYLVVLIPYAIERLFPKEKRSVYIIVMIALIFLGLTASGRLNYYFFWQEPQLFQYYKAIPIL